ncbi:hypothetical protein BpHYR1_053896 [Brachionus plicatilis]|uniref:Uncharacterized protein n=1 Tax=Brachionus plicatilis TaxID=10195 RepID=A0A3M7T1J7_BRAPC|nr:hypothetical protein BpHYR1_053896 [Brachionus plicatilis]
MSIVALDLPLHQKLRNHSELIEHWKNDGPVPSTIKKKPLGFELNISIAFAVMSIILVYAYIDLVLDHENRKCSTEIYALTFVFPFLFAILQSNFGHLFDHL